MIRLIVGLGNPGQQYERTRHNAGFLFVDRLAEVHGARWSRSAQFQGDVADCSIGLGRVLLLKPVTFMNRSGASVGALMRFYKMDCSELLVVHDELELAEGVVRLKRNGGHAGHNGLRDIISNTGTKDFFRLRIGIGRPSEGGVADYVLSGFSNGAMLRFMALCDMLLKDVEALVAGDLARINSLA
ncbi:aminoacyl-tRNA hydrolase [Methylomonas sp. HW2-6]|uniref:aminoacyl-tRNA hydrolase n=1 Tax=Methylomonas sp. HW2-6 TaxID=3376687 RepID=UPI0040415CD3